MNPSRLWVKISSRGPIQIKTWFCFNPVTYIPYEQSLSLPSPRTSRKGDSTCHKMYRFYAITYPEPTFLFVSDRVRPKDVMYDTSNWSMYILRSTWTITYHTYTGDQLDVSYMTALPSPWPRGIRRWIVPTNSEWKKRQEKRRAIEVN